jgi:gluconate 2-dehydrogenase gamma chain
MSEDTVPRRQFLLGAGLAGTAIAAGIAEPVQAQQPAAGPPPAPEAEPFVTLTGLEAAFIVAAVDTLIPADELSPSGSDCGVAIFIDRQLGSAWGGGAKMYRAGPFAKGKPEQGYQLALTPREYFAGGIVAASAWSRKTYGKEFDRLAPADRVAALKAMEDGKATFENFDAKAFFGQLHGITMAGFFSDLRRQPRQGRLEAARLPRPARHLRRQNRCLPRQALCRGSAIDRRFFLRRRR